MGTLALDPRGMQDGIWQALLTGSEKLPEVFVRLGDRAMPDVRVDALPGDASAWILSVPVPSDCLSTGVQTFVVSEAAGAELGQFSVVIPDPDATGLEAEVALLRAEVEMLKRALRRHLG